MALPRCERCVVNVRRYINILDKLEIFKNIVYLRSINVNKEAICIYQG